MKMRLFLRSRAGLTLILSLVASLMLVAANTRTSKSSVSPLAQKEIVKAKTHAPKLQILPRPKQSRQIELLVRNGYKRDVTAFVIALGDSIFYEDLLLNSDEVQRKIAPNVTKSFIYTLARPISQLPQPLPVTVYCVLFDGQKYDGDQQRTLDIFFRRTAIRDQFARVYPYVDALVREVNKQPGQVDSVAVKYHMTQLKEVVNLLSPEKPKGKPKHYGDGLAQGLKIVEEAVTIIESEVRQSDKEQAKQRITTFAAFWLSMKRDLDKSAIKR